MLQTAEYYILLFFLCSILGWVMEVCVKLVQHGRFINRGFFIGPYCPIYGVGAVLMAWLLPRYAQSIPATFILAMALCGTVEYITSWGMEKLFHARWWDYSHKHFQLNGRVSLDNLLVFGALGVIVVRVVKPVTQDLFASLSAPLVHGLCIGLCTFFLVDAALSLRILGRIRTAATHASGDSTEDITRFVRQTLADQGLLLRRALHAFPDARLYNTRLAAHLRRTNAEIKRLNRERSLRFRQKMEQLEARIRKER